MTVRWQLLAAASRPAPRFSGIRPGSARNHEARRIALRALIVSSFGEPGGIRTPNQLIKSQLLCR